MTWWESGMALEFDWIMLTGLGSSPQVEGKQNGSIKILFDEGYEQFFPTVEIEVLADRRSDVTWSEIEDQARSYAIEVLNAALTALESGSIEDLRTRAKTREKQREDENSVTLEESIKAALKTE
jgi:hypothetical protein